MAESDRISWRQFWHGRWVSCRFPEDMFAHLIAPADWKRWELTRLFGRTIYFVYPATTDGFARRRGRIL